ncbi:Ubiquitin carboxyl-terminal hydrolase 10 [Sesamum angolense]|uniref:Ubiquitin carboxyl-terminal hydrolase 10 n=1 Tax=Sesamum angolense TaxID=2727404 RepID=A0AAE1WA82_9LAMI|nr:Ubiquitin carboxyl-terminal hydrolase 10 [Sesamum angolense]
MTIPDSSGYHYMMENGSIELPCKPEEERRIVQELTAKAESNFREGNLYYVISSRSLRLDFPLVPGGGVRGHRLPLVKLKFCYLTSWWCKKEVQIEDLELRDATELIECLLLFLLFAGCKRRFGRMWFMAWQRYTGQTEGAFPFENHSIQSQSLILSNAEDRPGPIDNSDIIVNGGDNKDDDPQLLRTLEEGRDYVLVPQDVWEKLLKWYKGGPALPRKMISVGDQHKQFIVEASLHDLYVKVCQPKGLHIEKARIWDYFNKQKHTILISSSQTLEESNLQMDQDILLEVPAEGFGMDSTGNGLALVPVEPVRSSFSIAGGPTMSNGNLSGYSSNGYQRSTSTSTYGDMEDGYDGLKSVTRADRGDYSDEINRNNPLGMHGELALAFGDLLRKLWSSGRTPVAPRAFKGKLARFAPQFSGYNQHDSQELLAFLLDGLHEDLNRVKQKPYIETKDSDGRPDEEVADEFWRYHKARNDSVIVDICQGQYKSTLVCPVCDKISVTFDPFMYLSLPLPSTATRSMTITVFYGDGSGLPMPFTVSVLKQGCCKDLNQALAVACCLSSNEYLLLAEVYEHRIYRYLENPSEPLATIKDDEHIVAYRLLKREAVSTRLEICHRYQETTTFFSERKLFLTPLVTVLEDAQSGADIDLAVNRMLSPLRRKTFTTSTTTHSTGENGSALCAMEEQTNNSSTQLGSSIQSTEETEPDGMSSRELSFRLCITDDKGYGCRPIVKDSLIRPGRIVKVMLDWTEKEHELYDSSYLKDLPEVHKSGILAKKTKQEAISLFSCLDAFLKEEPLGPDDMWYCPRCKEHRQASKKLDLWRLPDILVFHLKRFSYSRWLKNKLDTFVNFPIHNLDLSKYVKSKDASEGSHIYELYAISNHYGGLGGGHYSAYCKLIDDNRWYHFDDAHVSPVNESEIKTSAAYVLFYRRVKPTSSGTVGEPSGHRAS